MEGNGEVDLDLVGWRSPCGESCLVGSGTYDKPQASSKNKNPGNIEPNGLPNEVFRLSSENSASVAFALGWPLPDASCSRPIARAGGAKRTASIAQYTGSGSSGCAGGSRAAGPDAGGRCSRSSTAIGPCTVGTVGTHPIGEGHGKVRRGSSARCECDSDQYGNRPKILDGHGCQGRLFDEFASRREIRDLDRSCSVCFVEQAGGSFRRGRCSTGGFCPAPGFALDDRRSGNPASRSS